MANIAFVEHPTSITAVDATNFDVTIDVRYVGDTVPSGQRVEKVVVRFTSGDTLATAGTVRVRDKILAKATDLGFSIAKIFAPEYGIIS